MTVTELVETCLASRQQNMGGSVILVMPKILKRFPRGEFLGVDQQGQRIVRYNAMKILAYLKKAELIEVTQVGEKKIHVTIKRDRPEDFGLSE